MGSSFVPRSIGAAALAILTSIGACAELLGGDGYHIRGEDAGADRAVASSAGGMPVAPPPPEGGPDVGVESPSFIDMDAPVVPSCMTAGDCPPPVEACRIAACEAHRCSTNLAPAGSDCGGNARCTTEGECVFCRLDGVANDSETDIDC